MDNKELFMFFDSINYGTSLDIFIELNKKENIKKYKKSYFYKNTKIDIKKAFLIYKANAFNDICNLFNSKLFKEISKGNISYLVTELELALEDFDMTKIDRFLDYLEERLSKTDFQPLQEKLDFAVKELKKIKI